MEPRNPDPAPAASPNRMVRVVLYVAVAIAVLVALADLVGLARNW